MLNWIVWNKTVYMYKNGFGINNLQLLICHKTKPKQILRNGYRSQNSPVWMRLFVIDFRTNAREKGLKLFYSYA